MGNNQYYESNKDRINKQRREYNKYLYEKAIQRICNYYNIKSPFCFFCGKKQTIENKKTILCIDHKLERLSGKKDELNHKKLYKHICECDEKSLDNYQLLCSKCNFMKEHIYEMLIQLKNKGDLEKYNKLLNIYNHTLIINNLNENESENK